MLTSVPASFLGGYFSLPTELYRPALGLVLLFAAWRLFLRKDQSGRPAQPPPTPTAMVVGAILGFSSGLIGVGGGIFISPLMILLSWAKVRKVSGIAALFILVNSISGLLGHVSSLQHVPDYARCWQAWPCSAVQSVRCGSCHLPVATILKALSAMLEMAGRKMFLL